MTKRISGNARLATPTTQRELAHHRRLGQGTTHEALHILEDHRAAAVGIEEAVDEVAAGAEVQLGDSVDRAATGRVRTPHDVLRVVPQAEVMAHGQRRMALRPVTR